MNIQQTSSFSPERRDQELRVRQYRDRLQFPIAGSFSDYSQEDLDATEGFFRYLLTLEGRPASTLAKQLIRDGVELPAPDGLSEPQLGDKLWEVIEGLEDLRTYLEHTDHLSDRELYTHLWEDLLNEPEYEFDDAMGEFETTIDLVGDGSDEAMELYHRFYADEWDRDEWMEAHPDYDMPDMEPLPFDRDRFLPRGFLEA
jgi:hypothetical protein